MKLVLLFFTASLLAQPKPDPALDSMRWMIGTWLCKGDTFATEGTTAHPTVGKVRVVSDVGNFWLSFRYEEEKSKENPLPAIYTGFWGYDAEHKVLVLGAVDSFGNFSTGKAVVSAEDRFVFEGIQHGQATWRTRDTFARSAKGELTHLGQITALKGDGKWIDFDAETCSRTR